MYLFVAVAVGFVIVLLLITVIAFVIIVDLAVNVCCYCHCLLGTPKTIPDHISTILCLNCCTGHVERENGFVLLSSS